MLNLLLRCGGCGKIMTQEQTLNHHKDKEYDYGCAGFGLYYILPPNFNENFDSCWRD